MSKIARFAQQTEVVVTGVGAITPLANSAPENWAAMLAGKSGITHLPEELAQDLSVKIGGQVSGFDPSTIISRSDLNRLDTHAQFGIAAGLEAMAPVFDESGSIPFDPTRFGISVGTSAGPVSMFQKATRAIDNYGPRKVPPGAVIYGGSDSAAAYLSVQLNAQATTVGYGATCASGAVALGEAMRAIRHGYLDAVLVIGAEDCLNRVNLAANANIRSLTTDFAEDPGKASRPFDRDRAGFVMSQGAAAILLESSDHAAKRLAKPLAKLVGYGSTSDAHHATAPHPEGLGAAQAMSLALADAGLEPADIGHINAHGTSTKIGDQAEFLAMQKVFGPQIAPVTASKSVAGHLLGAAGVFEAVIAISTLLFNHIPPTINLDNNDFELDIVTGDPRPFEGKYVMSNSFGFGGHNCSLIFSK